MIFLETFFFFQANLDPVPYGETWIRTRISTYADPLHYWQCLYFTYQFIWIPGLVPLSYPALLRIRFILMDEDTEGYVDIVLVVRNRSK